MKAKVKKIVVDAEVDDEGHFDVFDMEEDIDEIIEVLPKQKEIGGIFNNWYVDENKYYSYHKTWLEFIEEKTIMSDGDKFLKGLMEEINCGHLIEEQSSHWFPLYLDGIREYLSKFEN